MKCPKCNHGNPDGARFCMECGEKLENVCPKCAAKLPPEAKFCLECGFKLTEAATPVSIPRLEDMQDKLYIPEPLRQRRNAAKQELQGENRLVTALFADISGFTPLSNQHSPEAVVNIVNDCFKVIVDTVFKYEGDPNRFIGDNVLAFFGAPIAHENDPERAIMAALEMRDKVRGLSLNVSIGINTGMMYFGPIGTREHHEVSAYGPDINLARRLQEYAEPGQILVGNGTHRFTRRAFDFDMLSSLNLKGFDQPITAYSVQQMKLHPEKLRGIEGLRARMIGREHEFADLKESADEWLSGHGQMVSIMGEAGIGKSRLVSELKTYLASKDDGQFQHLEGRCVSIGQPISYWPFIDILRTYFNLMEGDDNAAIAHKVTKTTEGLFPESAEEALPFIGNMLSIRLLIEQDMVYREGDSWKARDAILNVAVPDTIQSVILSRVDRLQEEARYVLQCASVIGRLFRYRLLDHLTQHERKLNDYLDEFESRELIHEERTVPELEYAFKHAFTQEATYQGILERKRREFHRSVATGIETLYQERLEEYYAELAHHYSMSGDAEKAVEYLLKAGNRAKVNYDNDTAISHFKRAIDILDNRKIERQEWRLEALRGLGEVYFGTGKVAKALDLFQEAVKIGEDIGLEPHQLVRLYYWICGPLSWQGRSDEVILYSKKGLELLKDDPECLEVVLMNTHLGLSSVGKSDEFGKCAHKNMKIIKNIPYSVELGDAYQHIVKLFIYAEPNPQLAWEWSNEMVTQALRHHDLVTVSFAKLEQINIMLSQGDYKNAYQFAQGILDIIKRTGDEKYGEWFYGVTAMIMFILGYIEEAGENGRIGADLAERIAAPQSIVSANALLGKIALARCRYDEAISHYEKAVKTIRTLTEPLIPNPIFGWFADPRFELGRTYLRNGEVEKSIQLFNEFSDIVFAEPDAWFRQQLAFIWLMEGIEYIYRNSRGKLMDFCRSFSQRYADDVKRFLFRQWYLEPAYIDQYDQLAYTDDFCNCIDPSWTWIDKHGDCHYRLAENGGVEIHSVNGRDLHTHNVSAPCFIRQVSGDFAVEVCVSPVSDEKPQLGGLLVWGNEDNFVCFEKGRSDPYGFWFYKGRYTNVAGRGFLPEAADLVYLRIERKGNEFSAYCSIDGNNWLTCGKLEFAMRDNVSVGIYAHGMIDRTVYCGEYKEGSATLFRSFRIWTK